MTLSHALFPSMSRLTQVLMVLGGSLFIAIAAQIAVPMVPVPMTLQTLAILIVGLTYGARLGAATLVVYLAEGAMGLPVFANGAGTLAYMMGPTGGFLLGFVMMAFLAGLAVDRGIARGVVSTGLVTLAVSALLYVPGLVWPAAIMGKTFDVLWLHWMSPFLAGDVLKAVLAALIVTGGWALMKARKG
ncbi:MAG: biotin transporter BioY [Rhodobacter sp.]|nr:biotin transporter BioY [Rhodobacter sp.]